MNFRNTKIRFKGQKEIENQEKNKIDNVVARRFKIIIISIIVVGLVFGVRLYTTQINKHDYYDTKLQQYSTNTFKVDALRGEITDRNYKKLVYNKSVICATYYAVKNITDVEIESIVNFMIKNVDIDISSVTLREKKDYLIMKDKEYVSSLITDEENKKLREDEDYDTKYYNLQLKRITKSILKEHLSDDDIRYYKLYYTIKSCTSGSAVLVENISVKEASLIGENNDILRGIHVTTDWERAYKYKTMKQTLGKVSTKKQGIPLDLKDQLLALDYSNDSRVGTSGLEQQYEDKLNGDSSTYALSYDSNGDPIVKQQEAGSQGDNIQLSIDFDLQEKISKKIDSELRSHAGEPFNNHIYCILEDPKTGEILVMAGREYNRKTGEIIDYAAGNYLSAYLIGSTMKMATLYTCFKHNIIKANHYEVDDASGIQIAGTPAKHSWRLSGFGSINEVSALAYSSNIYMMKIIIKLAGGVYRYNAPLRINKDGFTKLRNGAGELGLGVKTGLDVPSESLGYRGNDNNSGHLLDFSIGQYDTYTNMQLATYISTIANDGIKVRPHLYKSSFTYDSDGNIITLEKAKTKVIDNLSSESTAFTQIKKGMRAVITYGTISGSFKGYKYKVSGKTGTAEDYSYSGNTDYPNHLFAGYASTDHPTVVVTCLVERQLHNNSAPKIVKYALNEYFKKYPEKYKG